MTWFSSHEKKYKVQHGSDMQGHKEPGLLWTKNGESPAMGGGQASELCRKEKERIRERLRLMGRDESVKEDRESLSKEERANLTYEMGHFGEPFLQSARSS
jgi:hypothetical protein